MQGIVHVRVDDRLIHGQVATRWVSYINASRIMVIDDAVAASELEKTLLRSAAPQGCNTSILPLLSASAGIISGRYQGQRVLVLLKSPLVALQLLESGVALSQLNIGNLSANPERVTIKRSVSVSHNEIQALKTLLQRGVKVTAQMTPEEPEVSILSFLPVDRG